MVQGLRLFLLYAVLFHSLGSGRAEAAGLAGGFGEDFGLDEFGVQDRDEHELRDPLAGLYCHRLIPKIYHRNHYLAAVVGVYDADSVRERESASRGESAPRADYRRERRARG